MDLLDVSWRRNVLACCMVHRAFMPRCRFHLYEHIKLCSGGNLTQVVHTLSQFPTLRKRVDCITIDATGSEDQSWVSSVPFCLPLTSFRLKPGILVLQGVDLSVLHPSAHQAFARVGVFSNIVLQDVRYSSYTQLVRFLTIAYNVRISYQPDSDHKTGEITGRLPPGRSVNRLRAPYSSLLTRRFTLDMSWAALGSITRDLDPFGFMGNWHIVFRGEYPSTRETTASATALANILKAFKQNCRQSDQKSIISFDIQSGPCTIELRRYRPYGQCFSVNFKSLS